MADTSYWFQQLLAERDVDSAAHRRALTAFLANWAQANGCVLTDAEVVRWDHEPALNRLVPAGFVMVRVQGWVREFDVDLADGAAPPIVEGLG
jgi:hypothetical protein